MKTVIKPVGTITRQRVARRSSSTFEWMYVYAVNGTSIGNSLKEAVVWAKRHGLTPVRYW